MRQLADIDRELARHGVWPDFINHTDQDGNSISDRITRAAAIMLNLVPAPHVAPPSATAASSIVPREAMQPHFDVLASILGYFHANRMVEDERRLDAAITAFGKLWAAPSATAASSTQTICWMIERQVDGRAAWWTGVHADQFDHDPNQGIRFSRQHDAFWTARGRVNSPYSITEHVFIGDEKVPAPSAMTAPDKDAMMRALLRYNDQARSFFMIANRIATELGSHALQTNFAAFAESTKKLLSDTNDLTNQVRDALSTEKKTP